MVDPKAVVWAVMSGMVHIKEMVAAGLLSYCLGGSLLYVQWHRTLTNRNYFIWRLGAGGSDRGEQTDTQAACWVSCS